MRNASGHECKMKTVGGSEKKKVNEKSHVVVVQNNGKEMCKKKYAVRAKLLFC